MTQQVPPLEANLCNGTFVVVVEDRCRLSGFDYDDCPGCVGCDYDTVSARMAAKAPADPFACLPKVDDEDDR